MQQHLRLWLSVAASLALACATSPQPAETGQLFLWEVARPDGSGGVAHLLGSVHMAEGDLAFDPAVESALAGADTLVLEIDPKELEPAHMRGLAVEKGSFQDGRTLDQVLAPETWAAFEQRIASAGLPIETFRAMEPWYALLTLQVLALQDEGYEVDQGVETMLTRSAALSGKPMEGLETVEQQLSIYDELPLELQARQLDEFLRQPRAESGDLSALIEAWRRGDTARLEHEVFDELAEDPSLARYYELFYFERNHRMARGIAERVDAGGNWFVAVGAAHVVGARGIPSLLAEHGYAVRQVPKTR